MYRKVILQIIKDEHDYLDHWIQYHSKLGFDFILVEDYFSESHEEICNKYDNVTLIKLFDFLSAHRINRVKQGEFRQYTILEEFIDKNCTGIYDYDVCLFIDPDEYMLDLNLKMLNTYCNNLLNENYNSAYLFNWKWMTSNDRNVIFNENPDLSIPVYERFKDEANIDKNNCDLVTNAGKMLINLRFFNNVNDFIKMDSRIPHYISNLKFIDNVYVYHYCTNSIKEYIKRLINKGEMTNEWFIRKLYHFNIINYIFSNDYNKYIEDNNLKILQTKVNVFN